MEYSIQEIFQLVAEKKMSKNEAMLLIKELQKQPENSSVNAERQVKIVAKADSSPLETHNENLSIAISDENSVRTEIIKIVKNILHLAEDEINFDTSFKDMGTDSISGIEIIRDINKLYNLNLDAVELYNFPTVPELADKVYKEYRNIQGINNISSSNLNIDNETHYNHEFLNPHFFEMRQKFIQEEGKSKNHAEKECKTEGKKVVLKLNKADDKPEDIKSIYGNVTDMEVPSISENEIRKQITDIVKNILHLDDDELDINTSFKDMGTDSISGVEITRDVNKVYQLNLDAVVLYSYYTVSMLATYVNAELQKAAKSLEFLKDQKIDLQKGKHYEHEFLDPHFFEMRQKFIQEGNVIPHDDAFKESKENLQGKDKKIILKQNIGQNQENIKPKVEKLKSGEESNKPKEEKLESNTESNRQNVENTKLNVHKLESKQESTRQDAIAIVGMSGRFPGALNLDEYWKNIKNGVDSVTEIPKERWDINQYYSLDPKEHNKTYCKWMGALSDVDKFDPLFFNISPVEAESMDPQQRIFLEEAWKALEDAGYSDHDLSNFKCGVFVGAARSDYEKKMEQLESNNTSEAFTGLSTSILASRISYFLNLKGPSIAIDTACSSSLVAIHMATLSILNQESDMAIAGGVRLMLTPDLQIQTSKIGMLSHSGSCKAFDKNADGIVMGEGVGVVVLKSYQKALEDNDHIYGIIRSSGMNQDGRTNGITAPSEQSQIDLELGVYQKGNINPENITMVEAHGTGTQLGDPIEVNALKTAFGKYTKDASYCSLGSVKNNIGHTTMASGVASVIKVLLCMKYKMIPPLIHFEALNEHISLDNSPFYINQELKEWKQKNGMKRQAAISSFGFSGTNCHLVIEEAPNS